MKVSEILKQASEYLNIDNLKEILNKQEDLTTDEKSKVDRLKLCFNLLIGELATSKFFLKSGLKVKSQVGQNIVDLAVLTDKQVRRVERVIFRTGDAIFLQTGSEIRFNGDGEECVIEFTYLPKEYDLDDDFDEYSIISTKILALGIAGEYLKMSEIFDSSERFLSEYDNALKSILQQNKIMPSRGWF